MADSWHKFEKCLTSFFRGDNDVNDNFQKEEILFATPMIEHVEEQLVDEAVLSETEEESEKLDEVLEAGLIVSEPSAMDVIDTIKNQIEKEERIEEVTAVRTEKKESECAQNGGDNQFEKLLSKTIDTIKYYDQLAARVENLDVKACLDDFSRKLIENLILSGCTPIDAPKGTFDMTRHRVVPFRMVEDGTLFNKLVRAGVEWNGEVKVMAIVEL